MKPIIVYLKGDSKREEQFDGGFADAYVFAEQAVESGSADRVLVQKDGRTIAEFPRPTRA